MTRSWTWALVLIAIAAPSLAVEKAATTQTRAVFKNGAFTTGWLDFELLHGNRLFVRAKVNGRDTVVTLSTNDAQSHMDKALADSLGLLPAADGSESEPRSVQVQIGDLTLQEVHATVEDFSTAAQRIAHAVPFFLNDDLFDNVVVDIDFARHRIAFHDPAHYVKPAGLVEIAVTKGTVPVSIEGGPPVPFDFYIGNSATVSLYPSYYRTHHLLDGRASSARIAGLTSARHEIFDATLRRVQFAGVDFLQAPGLFVPESIRGPDDGTVAGSIGLEMLSRFHLVVDYPHNRVYASRNATNSQFAKDRLGLALIRQDGQITVEFVAPGSPAQAAGFKVGDTVTSINGEHAQSWPDSRVVVIEFAEPGTEYAMTLADGTTRRLKAKDFF